MLTNTKNILSIATSLAIDEVLILEAASHEVATRCSSRINMAARRSKDTRAMRFSCRVLLAVETPSKTCVLLRVQRLGDAPSVG